MSHPTICVTVTARTVEGARVAIEAAAADGADLAEIRFDRWPESERRRAGELFPAHLPLVATYRSVAEGGEGSADPVARSATLRALRRHPFEAIDRELARDPAPPKAAAHRSIASRHLAAPVDWSSFREFASGSGIPGERSKIVAPSTLREYLGPFREATAGLGGILLAQGPAGPLSRVWPGWLGTDWVFASPGPTDPIVEPSVEPSQLPVDRLRSVLRRDPPSPLFAVLGHPIAFSESPALHHRWLRADGHDGAYLALDVETEREFRDLLETIGPRGFKGINVTHPWKPLARSVATRVESSAAEAEAANCLTWDGSEWSAALTDVDALERRFTELRGSGRWPGRSLTILGSGASARAAIVAARRLGVAVEIRARDVDEIDRLHHRFPETVHGGPRGPASLLVHATPVGRSPGDRLDVPLDDLIGSSTTVLDLVYGDDGSPVRRAAEAAGATYEDGRRLLLYQAEESYRRWWGHRPTSLATSEVPG